MGIRTSFPSQRRRLTDEAGGFETYEKWYEAIAKEFPQFTKIEFRPFNGWNYSYTESWERDASFSIWAFVTLGSLGVDWREAAIVLGGSMWAQETVKKNGWNAFKKSEKVWNTMGASWVHNVQAGYLFYHMIFRRNKRWLVWLAALYEGAADAICFSEIWGKYDNYAHGEGLAFGLMSGFLLDFVFKKKQPLI